MIATSNYKATNELIIANALWICLQLLLFLVSPICSIVLQSLVILIRGGYDTKVEIYVLISSLSLMLGLINYVKIPESDMLVYIDWYRSAYDINLINYFSGIRIDYFYYFLTWSSANLLSLEYSGFILLFTCFLYFLFLSALFKISSYYDANVRLIVLLLLTAAMMPQVFSISAHLNRQFLAGTLLVLAFYYIQIKKWKFSALIILLAGLSHSSAVFFVSIFLFTFVVRNMRPFFAFLIVIVLVVVTSEVRNILGSFLQSIDSSSLSYLGSRVSQNNFDLLSGLNPISYLLILFVAGVSIVRLSKNSNFKSKADRLFQCQLIFQSSGLAILLLYSQFQGLNEVSSRYFFYLYFFLFIIIARYITTYKLVVTVQKLLGIVMPFYFILGLLSGQTSWSYTSPELILLLFWMS